MAIAFMLGSDNPIESASATIARASSKRPWAETASIIAFIARAIQ